MENYLIDKIKKMKELHSSVLISVVGGGGKTTTIFKLANTLKKSGSVLVTTTTAMFHPRNAVDELFYKSLPDREYQPGSIVGLYKDYNEIKNKVSGVSEDTITQILSRTYFDYILNEADGARRRPLKSYAEHEPVIPRSSHIVFVLLGADGFGKELSDEYVHRANIFSEVSKTKIGDKITADSIINLLTSNTGFLKGIPNHADAYILINKSKSYPIGFDIEALQSEVFRKTDRYKAILFTEMQDFIIDHIFEAP